jgi:GT2 family glycosyltransferase
MGGGIQVVKPTVSYVTLTWNRWDIVNMALPTVSNGGYPIHEVIWVDNGSTDGLGNLKNMQSTVPETVIKLSRNRGCAVGYNSGFRLASSDWIAVPGCDMLMPEGWLAHIIEYVDSFPNVSVWSTLFDMTPDHYDLICRERRTGPDVTNGVLTYEPAICIGPMLIKRSIFDAAGYLPEDGGLYGWEDVRWDQRVRDQGFKTGLITDIVPKHLADSETPEYREWKDEQVKASTLRC